jgi:hypothetical protein
MASPKRSHSLTNKQVKQLTHILNFFQIIVVVLQTREVFLRLIESEPKSIQIMVVSSLIEKNPFLTEKREIASGCGAHMLAILRRTVISFAHAFPPPPDTITISPTPPRPQDQLPHCRGLAPRRVPRCSAHQRPCRTGSATATSARPRQPGGAVGGRPAGGVLALRAWAARPPCSGTAALVRRGAVLQTRGLGGSGRGCGFFQFFLGPDFFMG